MGSSLEFMIDVKQRASGNAVSELDRLESQLEIASNKYKELESAAANAQKKLDAHGSKLQAAKIDLGDAVKSGDSAAAAHAAGAIQKLSAEEDKLKAHAAGAQAAMHKQAAELTSLANETGGLAKQEKAMKDAEHAAETLGQRSKKLGNAFGGLPGPLGAVGQRIGNAIDDFSDLKEAFGGAGAAAAVGALSIFALAAAATVGAAKVLELAVSAADAQRDLELTTQAILENEDAGSNLADAYSDIARDTGIGSARLVELTRSLKDANVSAEEMPAALEALAEQEKALGDSSGTQKLIDKLKSGQETVGQLADEMDKKFGGIVESKLLGLTSQFDRLKRGLGSFGASLDIEPLLKGLKTIVDLFDDDTAAGRQMQDTFKSIFQPLLDGATSALPSVRRGILYVELGIVDLEVALDPLATKIRDSFETGILGDFAVALSATGGVADVVSASFEGVVATWETAIDALTAMIGLVQDLSSGMGDLGGAAKGATGPVGNLTTNAAGGLPSAMEGVGENTSKGLADGITTGGSLAEAAMGGVVGGVIGIARAGFDQHSPSKLFEHIGLMNMAGLEIGHEKGANDVEAGIDRLTSVPSASPVARSSGGASVVFNEGAIKIDVSGGADPEAVREAAREGVREALEEAGLELGADIFGDEEDEAA